MHYNKYHTDSMLFYFDREKVWQSRTLLPKNKTKQLSLKFLALALRRKNLIKWVYAATLWFKSELKAPEGPMFWDMPINLMLFEIMHDPCGQNAVNISEINQWQLKPFKVSAFDAPNTQHICPLHHFGGPAASQAHLIPSLFAFPHEAEIKICWFVQLTQQNFPFLSSPLLFIAAALIPTL